MTHQRVMAKQKSYFSYALYRGTRNAKCFWRWEVFNVQSKVILKAGTLYGTGEDAKATAESVISTLGPTEKNAANLNGGRHRPQV
jgi:hypothetical protein